MLERTTQPMTDAVIERPVTLIEKLEQVKECWHDDGENNVHCVIDDCIDIVKQHSDWISVDERLPEHNKPILAWVVSKAGSGYAFKAHYENSWHLDFGEITHWRELPQPPSEVQE